MARTEGLWTQLLRPRDDWVRSKRATLSVPDRPIKPKVQQVIDKLERAGVPVRVLLRYGIENYFSQNALEKVLGKNLSGSFPLDEPRAVSTQIGGYDKNLTAEVIKHR